ncbi:hypothetical protein AKO1_006088 [Acrasis kona]|uniref:Uncharacterized protein n=1 Tax=Acrasis kona TaxID=1008807 RepID=A0AAW2YHT3_9EUKA
MDSRTDGETAVIRASSAGRLLSVLLTFLSVITILASIAYLALSATIASYGTMYDRVTTTNGTYIVVTWQPYYHTPTFITHCIYAGLIMLVMLMGIFGSMYTRVSRKNQYSLLSSFLVALFIILWLMLVTAFFTSFVYTFDLYFSTVAVLTGALWFLLLEFVAMIKLRTMYNEDRTRSSAGIYVPSPTSLSAYEPTIVVISSEDRDEIN